MKGAGERLLDCRHAWLEIVQLGLLIASWCGDGAEQPLAATAR
jgi:hypothetical protein